MLRALPGQHSLRFISARYSAVVPLILAIGTLARVARHPRLRSAPYPPPKRPSVPLTDDDRDHLLALAASTAAEALPADA